MSKVLDNFLGTLILIGFISIVYIVHQDSKQHETNGNSAKIDSIQSHIDSLFKSLDSASIVENNLTKKITIINNHYDSNKVFIINLSDSAQFNLLRSNIAGHVYLLDSSRN